MVPDRKLGIKTRKVNYKNTSKTLIHQSVEFGYYFSCFVSRKCRHVTLLYFTFRKTTTLKIDLRRSERIRHNWEVATIMEWKMFRGRLRQCQWGDLRDIFYFKLRRFYDLLKFSTYGEREKKPKTLTFQTWEALW